MKRSRTTFAFLLGIFVFPILFAVPQVFAQSEIEQLQSQISERNNRLSEIEAEITKYELALLEVGAEKDTLQRAINQLELERKKVVADIAYTENKISATDLELSKLILEITNTEERIEVNKAAIISIIQDLEEAGNETMVEVLLRHENISEFWGAIETLETVRNSMRDRVRELSDLKNVLEEKRDLTSNRRNELVSLKSQYDDQQMVLENNKQSKSELLNETKSEEAKYQQLLQEKKTAREQIERELRDFEAKLQFILDPNTIPTPGTQVFNWPVDNVIITQYFGGTEFAKRNASVYGGRAYHPGVDFGAPRGTQIKAPLGGVVRDTGNTDLVPGCYSWGKWTLIDHANGLSTLYAHQDVVSVSPGQKVVTGQVIGYVGNTGYSTGPHLHLTVYAKDGVNIRKFSEIKTVTSCGPAKTPVAATEAYIDPMDYLPAR